MNEPIDPDELRALMIYGEVLPSLAQRMSTSPETRLAIDRLMRTLVATIGSDEPTAEDLAMARQMTPTTMQMIRDAADRMNPGGSAQGASSLRLRSRAPSDDTQAPEALAADTGGIPPADASPAVNAIFVDPQSGRGHIRPVLVELAESDHFEVDALIDCDPVMANAGQRAVAAALDWLRQNKFYNPVRPVRASWAIVGEPAKYHGASIGLAVALATVATATRTDPGDDFAVSGAIDGQKIGPVKEVTAKWNTLRTRIAGEPIRTIVLPAASVYELPADALSSPEPRLLLPGTLQEAIVSIFGEKLGIGPRSLAAASEPVAIGSEIHIDLWVNRVAKPAYPSTSGATARSIGPDPIRTPTQWYIGDNLQINVKVSRAAYVGLFNVGSSGGVHMLIPNRSAPNVLMNACQTVSFPAPPTPGFVLQGPPGVERLIAVASSTPIKIPAGGGVFPSISPEELENDFSGLVTPLQGRSEREFLVLPAPDFSRGVGQTSGSRSIGMPTDASRPSTTRRWQSIDF